MAPLLSQAAGIAAAQRFFHWHLAFPEVFADGGFDAVIGNPPWDMVRGRQRRWRQRDDRRQLARCATRLLPRSGVYVVEPGAHSNRYQLFVERGLQLLRPGGRLGSSFHAASSATPAAHRSGATCSSARGSIRLTGWTTATVSSRSIAAVGSHS
jgi:hypothetical protein